MHVRAQNHVYPVANYQRQKRVSQLSSHALESVARTLTHRVDEQWARSVKDILA